MCDEWGWAKGCDLGGCEGRRPALLPSSVGRGAGSAGLRSPGRQACGGEQQDHSPNVYLKLVQDVCRGKEEGGAGEGIGHCAVPPRWPQGLLLPCQCCTAPGKPCSLCTA